MKYKQAVILLMTIICFPMLGQDPGSDNSKTERKLTREEKKQIAHEKTMAEIALSKALIISGRFALKPDLIRKGNEWAPPEQGIYFITIDSTKARFQLGILNSAKFGLASGSSVVGNVESYEYILDDKRGRQKANFTIRSSADSNKYRVYITVYKNGKAEGTINGSLLMLGKLIPLEQANFFQDIRRMSF